MSIVANYMKMSNYCEQQHKKGMKHQHDHKKARKIPETIAHGCQCSSTLPNARPRALPLSIVARYINITTYCEKQQRKGIKHQTELKEASKTV